MPLDYRYFKNESAYRPVARLALASHFETETQFDAFYDSLTTPERKTEFLRSACFYYYLVQRGDWVVNSPDSNPVIDYFTNSYKVVGIFALIESLSDESHIDFYDWLSKKDSAEVFPIEDAKKLSMLHSEYKATFGSIRRCIKFFDRLPKTRQTELCNAVRIDGKPMSSIKNLAQHLYNLRSKFVHEGNLVVQLSGSSNHFQGKKFIRTEFSMALLQSAFEEGLVAYFNETN